MAVMRPEGVEQFFRYARERHACYLRRLSGAPPPWTDDEVIASYRFTNIFRETDRTTVWFRKNVRERYGYSDTVLLATVVFRWFNKIETGEAMFGESDGQSPFDQWLQTQDLDVLRQAILRHRGGGPYVNGAYIVKTPNGMTKLEGVLYLCEKFRTAVVGGLTWGRAAEDMRRGEWTLEQAWNWVRGHECQGDFTAYEVVTDLRHTRLLGHASDIMAWANPGPGANRGANRVQGLPTDRVRHKEVIIDEMRTLLRFSRVHRYWPKSWPAWEMREVEHTLCEFDKYMRAVLGEGTPKQRYDQLSTWSRERAQ